MASKLAALYFGREIQWLAVLFGLSAVVFAINAYRSYRRTAVRTECRRIGRPVVHFEIVSAFVGDIAMNHLAHRARYKKSRPSRELNRQQPRCSTRASFARCSTPSPTNKN